MVMSLIYKIPILLLESVKLMVCLPSMYCLLSGPIRIEDTSDCRVCKVTETLLLYTSKSKSQMLYPVIIVTFLTLSDMVVY